ncbi:MAG: DNA repair protein RecO [Anaerolineae bacterium]
MTQQGAERSRVYRTEAIVLHQQDYGEADRILRLLTPEGRLDVIAKGVRRVTSHKVGHLGLFTRVQLMLARGKSLDIVTQAEAVESYVALGRDLKRFSHACYVGELAAAFAQHQEESHALYGLLAGTLAQLQLADDLELWTRWFEVRVLLVSGFWLELYRCVMCGAEVQPRANVWSADEGGIICPRCALDRTGLGTMSLPAQKVLRFLASRNAEDVARLRLTASTSSEVGRLLRSYLRHVLERELNSVGFLDRLQREISDMRAGRAAHDRSEMVDA